MAIERPNAAVYAARKRRKAKRPLPPDDPRHGTANGYNNHMCRCMACKAAWAEECRESGRLERHRDKIAPPGSTCLIEECERNRDRAYLTGYCHRHNVEFGLKPR